MRLQTMCLVGAGVILHSTGTSAQSPTYGARETRDTLQSVAANNPWYNLGAQFGYRFAGNSDFSESLIASSRVVMQRYEFPSQSSRVGIPLIGNLSKLTASLPSDSVSGMIGRLMNTAEGVNLGLYPYFQVYAPDDVGSVQVTFYASTVWKLNAGRDRVDSSTVALHQGRFSGGLGLDLFIGENKALPVSLSIEPVLTVLDEDAFQRITGEAVSRIYSVELTGILPIRNDMGLLAQYTLPDPGESQFRVGLIYIPKDNTQPDSEDGDEDQQGDTGTTGQIAARVSGTLQSQDGSVSAGTQVKFRAYHGGTVNGSCDTTRAISDEHPTTTNAQGVFQGDINVKAAVGTEICIQVSSGDRTMGKTTTVEAAGTDGLHPVRLREPVKFQN